MELLKAKIQHLEGVASAAKAQAQREQDAAKLAKAEAAEHKVCEPFYDWLELMSDNLPPLGKGRPPRVHFWAPDPGDRAEDK